MLLERKHDWGCFAEPEDSVQDERLNAREAKYWVALLHQCYGSVRGDAGF